MAFIRQPIGNSTKSSVVALTPLELYLQRVKSVTDSLRAEGEGLSYIPLQFGGISGQQQSLLARSVVKVVDFKVNSSE